MILVLISQYSNIVNVTLDNQSSLINSFTGKKNNKTVFISFSTKSLTAGSWTTLGTLHGVTPLAGVTCVGLISTGAGNTAIVDITTGGVITIYPTVSGTYRGSVTFLCS